MSESKILKDRIAELEAEVADREKDIAHFRNELAATNKKLESVIGQLQRDLRTVQQLQQALVPTELPNIPGFEFSSKFIPSFYQGGDYFDIYEHDDKARFGMVMASSTGHGMSALLLSVLFKLSGQMQARQGAEPHNVIKSMVSEMLPQIQGSETADIFYGLLDRRQFALSYCRVGNVVALLQDHSSGELRLLKPGADPISKSFKQDLSSETVSLNPRDRLIFCTPGVVEATNLGGESFGQERLFKTVLGVKTKGVHELRNEILYQVQKFCNGCEPKKDMTVMVVEVKDRVIKLAQPQ